MTGNQAATIAGILFDKDGTLLDYDESWVPVNYEVASIAADGDAELASHLLLAGGMDPDHRPYRAGQPACRRQHRRDRRRASSPPAPGWTSTELTVKLDALFSHSADFSAPVTDLAAFFLRPARARATSWALPPATTSARSAKPRSRFGFVDYLHYIAGYDSGFGTKPEPGMVLGFCEATGLDPHQIAVVGDNNHDLHMGRNAGAGLTVAVLTGTGSPQSLAAASDHCLNDITELESLLPLALPV